MDNGLAGLTKKTPVRDILSAISGASTLARGFLGKRYS